MRKGNRLAAMIMAAVLAAGTVTGPVFAADYTVSGDILSEEGSYDYLSENGGLTGEAVQENSALSIDPASQADGIVSESSVRDGAVSESAAGDQESVSVLSTDAADWSEDGNTMDAQLPGEAEVAGAAEETADSADSSAAEAADQAAAEETSSEAGEETEAEAVEENAEMPGDADASADGASSIDETEDVSSGITDDGEMIADETPAADQEPQEDSAPVQEDNALTEDQTAADNSAEFLTEDPSAIADPEPADVNEGRNADAEVLEEPGAGETVSEEKAAGYEGYYYQISLDETSLELLVGGERTIYVWDYDETYYDEYEMIESAKSSDSNVLSVTSFSYGINCIAKKPGNVKVTIKGTYGTVLTINVKVLSFLEDDSLTVKAEHETTSYVYDDGYGRFVSDYHWFSVSTSNKDVATASLAYGEYGDFLGYVVIKGIRPGNAKITVKNTSNGGISEISVKVVKPSFNLSTSNLTINKLKTWQVTSSGSDIGKASSSNTNILKVEKVNARKVLLKPTGHGKATVTITNKFGTSRTVSVAVSYLYFRALLNDRTRTGTAVYGSTVLKGKTAPSATASVRIGGKTFTGKADSSGTYKIKKVPAVKIGTNLKLTFKLGGASIAKTVKVGKGNSTLSSSYVYKDSTKISVTVTNTHGSDKIVINIAGKQYTKKLGKLILEQL